MTTVCGRGLVPSARCAANDRWPFVDSIGDLARYAASTTVARITLLVTGWPDSESTTTVSLGPA